MGAAFWYHYLVCSSDTGVDVCCARTVGTLVACLGVILATALSTNLAVSKMVVEGEEFTIGCLHGRPWQICVMKM